MSGINLAIVGNSYGSLPVNTDAPAVSGTAAVGQSLSSTTGTWTGAPAPAFTYQWQRGTTNIGSATSSSYTIVSADTGNTLRCVVTATNSLGAVSANSNSSSVPNVVPSGRAVYGGGTGAVNEKVMDYVEIATTGNATDFGDLILGGQGQETSGGSGSTTRGIWAGGYSSNGSPNVLNVISYITVTSAGNNTDFGNLGSPSYGTYGGNNQTRSVFGGGNAGLTQVNEYITIASTGNAASFGDLGVAHDRGAGCCSPTQVFNIAGVSQKQIDVVTTATTGDATDFGDLLANAECQAASNSTRGIVGASNSNVDMSYITMASAGNAVDFGDLSRSTRPTGGAAANATRWTVAGGGSNQNEIQYVTIASTGNASDFGDLTVARYYMGGLSNSNGGLY